MLVESKASCHVADASLSRLELIWPITKNVQKDMCFRQKALEVNGLFQKKYTPPPPRLLREFPQSHQSWGEVWIFSGTTQGGAGTYSIGITVKSSCFCHFPTQFVHGHGSLNLMRANSLIPYVLYSILLSCHSLVYFNGIFLLITDFDFCYLIIY